MTPADLPPPPPGIVEAPPDWPAPVKAIWPRVQAEAEAAGAGWTDYERRLFAVMVLAIGYTESGWNLDARGDGGASVGYFQIHTAGVGSGYTVAQLRDADLQFKLMMPRFRDNFARLWAAGAEYHLTEQDVATGVGHDSERPHGYAFGYLNDRNQTFTYNGQVLARTYLSKHYGEAFARFRSDLGI